MITAPKINPCICFNKQGEEAAKYYVGIFKNSRILRTTYYGKEGYEQHHVPEGTVLTVEIELEGVPFLILNGPSFQFTEGISLMVHCDTQDEVDYYWDKLTVGGDEKAQVCGWLKDKYGVSWQIAPKVLTEMMASPNREKAGRAMLAMMQMKKIDIAKIQQAFDAD